MLKIENISVIACVFHTFVVSSAQSGIIYSKTKKQKHKLRRRFNAETHSSETKMYEHMKPLIFASSHLPFSRLVRSSNKVIALVVDTRKKLELMIRLNYFLGASK